MSEIFTVEFGSATEACKQIWRILGWKPQIVISVSKLLSEKSLPPLPFPLTKNPLFGIIDLQQLCLCYENPTYHYLYLNTDASFLPKQSKEITSIYYVCYIGLFPCFLAHLTQDKNKDDKEVRISKAPVLVSARLVRMSGVSSPFFFFFNLSQTFYISQAAKHQKRSNTN